MTRPGMVDKEQHTMVECFSSLRQRVDGPGTARVKDVKERELPMQAVDTQAAKRTAATGEQAKGFTDAERAAMRERAREMKAEARASKDREEGERAVLAAIAAMTGTDRALGERLHAIIAANAPDLAPKTWYGMPAYARDGKVVCFFKCAAKFGTRYGTLGFSDAANLDDGAMWPIEFALTELTAEAEARIGTLVKQAVS